MEAMVEGTPNYHEETEFIHLIDFDTFKEEDEPPTLRVSVLCKKTYSVTASKEELKKAYKKISKICEKEVKCEEKILELLIEMGNF